MKITVTKWYQIKPIDLFGIGVALSTLFSVHQNDPVKVSGCIALAILWLGWKLK